VLPAPAWYFMETIDAASAPSADSPTIVGFSKAPFSIPVRPGDALRWALIALLIANLGRIPLFSLGDNDATVVLNDLAVAGLAAFCLINATLRRSLWIDAVGWLALGFAAIGFGSAVAAVPRFGLSAFQLVVSLSYLFRWLTYFGVYLFIVNNVRPDQVPGVWRSLSSVMLAFVAFGVVQSFFLPDFAQIVYPNSRGIDWDPQGHRLVSTVLEPNIAAAMILLVLLIQLAQIAVGARVKWWQPSLLLIGLALTLSRSAILGLVIGLGVIVMARGISVRLVKLFGLILFLSMGLIPQLISVAQTYGRFDFGQGTSAGTRVMAWLLALDVIAEHPFFGVGFNTFGYVRENRGLELLGHSGYGSDGGLLFAAVMTGIVGLALYLAMLWSVVRRCRRIWRDQAISPETRGLAIGVAAGIAAICVESLFANSIFTTFVMEILWVTWALTFVVERQQRSQRVAA
jgi:putative inorganic carbon (hco3(-)) transporter